MDRDDKIELICKLLFIIIFFTFMIIAIYEGTTFEKLGTEQVKCIDKYGRPFEDEWCTKTVTCSWLGLAGNKKCAKEGNSAVGGGE